MNIDIPDFSQAHILTVGDVMLDRYWFGDTSRISPEAPVPVVKMQQTEERPGGAGNVALNLAALEAKSTLLAYTGDDTEANTLYDTLTAANVTCHFVKLPHLPTITKLRILSQHQQLMRVDFEKDFRLHDNQKLIANFNQAITKNVNAIILSDYGKGTLQNAAQLIAIANDAGIPVFVDPKNKDFNNYRGATIITPNFKEFQEVVGTCHSEEEITQKAQALLQQHNIKALLITRGAYGMTLFCRNATAIHFPTKAQDVFDVTGAGDTVIATLAAAVACGCELVAAVELANIAAGLAVSKLGSAAISTPELRCQATQTNYPSGIVNEEQLQLARQNARMHNKKVVLTNGCFDILHMGHIHYLEQAKQLGDYLIVAVNDDNSVKRLKGNSRPINTLEKRMAVLAGLSAVDWVTPFAEDTPERLISKILPDVLVKGGDWKPEQIAGSNYVLQNGGEVKVLDFVTDCSTTSMIEKIQNHKGTR